MSGTRPQDDSTGGLPPALRRQAVQRRRQAMDNLRRLAVQLDAASALERRADETSSSTLAGVLRERAAERRRVADVVREHLAEELTPSAPPNIAMCDTQPMPAAPRS